MENRVVDIALNKDEMKLWSSLALKGIDNAMTGLATMVNREIRMSSLSLKQVPASDAPNLVGGADKMVIGIYLAFEGDATGHLMLVHQPDVALAIIDMLLGNEPGATRDLNEMEQSALGRMFGYGDIEILTASELGINTFKRIENPVGFKQAMLNAKEKLDYGEHEPPKQGGVPQLIAQLESLRQQGILTNEEFQQKKAQLLAKI